MERAGKCERTKELTSGFDFIPDRFNEAQREGDGGDGRWLTGRVATSQRTADEARAKTEGL